MWIDQAIKQQDVNVRLTQGMFTQEASTLEFLVEYPFAESQPDFPPRFRLSGTFKGNVEGVAPTEEVRTRSSWGCGGRQLVVVEGLGPVTDPARGIKLRFPKLVRRDDAGATAETIENTWLTFQVSQIQMSDNTPGFEVNQSLTQQGVSLIVERVTLGQSETLAYYRVDKGEADDVSSLGKARIRYDGSTWQNGEGGSALVDGENVRFYRFPAPPSPAQRMDIDFRSMAVTTYNYLQLPIKLPSPRENTPMTLNQDVNALEGTFRIVSLAPQENGFQVVIEPTGPQARLVIPGMGSEISIQARDNLGNIYEAAESRFEIAEVDDTLLPARYMLTFQGALAPEATSLDLLIEDYWQALPGPWLFELSATPPTS